MINLHSKTVCLPACCRIIAHRLLCFSVAAAVVIVIECGEKEEEERLF